MYKVKVVFDGKGGNRIRTCCSVTRPVRYDYRLSYHLSPAMKKKHGTLKISRKQWDCVFHLHGENKKYQVKLSCEKWLSRLLVNVYNLAQFVTQYLHVLLPTMIVDCFRFWYSTIHFKLISIHKRGDELRTGICFKTKEPLCRLKV